MRRLLLDKPDPIILCLGAHSDDIEIGAGATLVHLMEQAPRASIHWVVFSGEGKRADEGRSSAALLAGERLASIDQHEFRDGFFPGAFDEIKESFRSLQQTIDPDLVFTHWRHDLHQDHRLIAELTGQTFRDHLILEYEILKYDGGLGSPNVYVPVSTAEANRKVDHLLSTFTSQSSKYWFTDETLRAFMRVRGVECRAPSGYAEAFFGSKLVFEGSAARDI
jgi:LmbE family N-acetylglucosaminyl deacetylase